LLAYATVPFPEFLLFLELPAIGKTENGARGQILEKYARLNRVMGMKRPGQFSVALAVGPWIVDLFPDFGVDFQWKNIFLDQ
jgi:hypothetical protein